MSARFLFARVALLVVVAILGTACSGGGASFDPASACTTDGRFPGAYPDVEALVPRVLDGKAADTLDSGRSCTAAALATLATHGVTELRFAGGLWQRGSRTGTTLVVFESPAPLESAWLAEFYEAGARAARKTEAINTTAVAIDSAKGQRLDTLNDDSYQSVVVWKRNDRIVAVIVATDVHAASREAHEAAVTAGIHAFTSAG